MKTTAVIYKSKYGSTKQYAQWIAEVLDADLFELCSDSASKLGSYKTIIFGGALYAGSINGFSEFTSVFKTNPDKNYILFVTGLSPSENTLAFKGVIDRHFSPEMHAKVKAFYLRGGIDYKNLAPLHRIMMGGVNFVLSRKKSEALSEGEKVLLAAYGKTVSYLDESALEPLLTYASSLKTID